MLDCDRLAHETAASRIGQQLPAQVGGPTRDGADLAQRFSRLGRRRQILERQFGVAQHRGEQVVEVVGDPAGKQTEAFQFLDLLHLRLELAAVFVRLLLFGDVGDHPLFGNGSVGALDGSVDNFVPAVVFRTLDLPTHDFPSLRPIIRAPGTRLIQIVHHLVAGLADGITPRARDQLGVHELDLAVGRADVDEPVEALHHGAVARFAVTQGRLGLLARADVARSGQDHVTPVNNLGAQGHLDPE